MDIREAGKPCLYRYEGVWHRGLVRQWRREDDHWVGDVWHDGHTIPIPAEHLRSTEACQRCALKWRPPHYV
jgi:hypothetical protein